MAMAIVKTITLLFRSSRQSPTTRIYVEQRRNYMSRPPLPPFTGADCDREGPPRRGWLEFPRSRQGRACLHSRHNGEIALSSCLAEKP